MFWKSLNNNIWVKLQAAPVLTVYAVAHSDAADMLQLGTYAVAFITAIVFGLKTFEDYKRSRNVRVHEQAEQLHEESLWEAEDE